MSDKWSSTISDAFDPSHNSFGALRLLFAAFVLVDHSYPLGGFGADPDLWTKKQLTLGNLTVLGFFVISGFLVTRSADTSRSTVRYFWKRILRIFPAFWICLGVTILVFGPIAYVHQFGSLSGYFGSTIEPPLGYFTHNALLNIGQFNIDDLLGATPYAHSHLPQAFDGSFWTLIYEFKCYIAVGVLGFLAVYRRAKWIVPVITVGLLALQIDRHWHPTALSNWPVIWDPEMVSLGLSFALGAVLYLYRDRIPLNDLGAVMAVIVFVLGIWFDLYFAIGQITFAYVCVWAAMRLPLAFVDRRADLSYGIYIYAFPVQQLASLHRVNTLGIVSYMLICLVATVALATLSWFLIERPAMQLKSLRLPRVSPHFARARS